MGKGIVVVSVKGFLLASCGSNAEAVCGFFVSFRLWLHVMYHNTYVKVYTYMHTYVHKYYSYELRSNAVYAVKVAVC